MKNFLIGGTIIDDSSQAWAFEDVTPSQVRAVLAKLEPDEGIVFDISSPGGSVTAGISIANMIREASKKGHPCKAHVTGIAASMASVIACACDEIDIDESAFMMIHNPWTVSQGDADDLRKSAEILDQMKQAILGFYRGKFEKTDEELCALMDAETWFTGANAADFGFKANVIATEEPLRAAACARQLPGFAKIPEAAEKLFALGKPVAAEPPAAPAPAEDDLEAKFTARLSAAMKSRDTEINELKAKLVDVQKRAAESFAAVEQQFKDSASAAEKNFQDQLEAKDKELMTAKAEITRLAGALDQTKKELTEASSALEVKVNALAELNARVNTPSDRVAEPSYDEVVNDPHASPKAKLAAAKKEIAKRRASKN